MAEQLQEIGQLIAAVCGVHPSVIQVDRDLREYGMDSVRAVELVVRLEEAFSISVPDEQMHQLRTMADVSAYVTRERSAASAA